MSSKIENAGEIERRVTRIFKEVDINNIVRQLKMKANSEETKKEFCTMDARYSQLSEMISYLRRDCDNLTAQMKKTTNLNISSV